MMRSNPMYWLIDIETYDFDIGVLKGTELRGTIMILSSQLWSLIRGDTVFSMLIGPGIFKGTAQVKGRVVDVIEFVGGLMFDPSKLRLDEPLPEVDIVHPEVIDPLESGREEEIVTIIRKIIVEHGNILPGQIIMKQHTEASVPMTAHAIDLAKKIKVTHVSGVQRAKFILAGTNGPMYKRLVTHYHKRGFLNPERVKIMTIPFRRFSKFSDDEAMKDWMIVEKAGMETQLGQEAYRAEFEEVMKAIKQNEEKYIFEL
ncbi:MAG: hypothetical protein K9W43_07245 [Candidatus Thorarchaeota archaeon]|nr:hypothetical protein [Candidatus Thorarchaeota archaeon]